MTPVDINLYKTANLPETYMKYNVKKKSTREQREDSKIPITQTLKNNGLDINVLKDIIEISTYTSDDLTLGKFFGSKYEEIKQEYPMLNYDIAEEIIKISDYNKIAKLYGIEQYELNDDEFIVICDFDGFETIRNIE